MTLLFALLLTISLMVFGPALSFWWARWSLLPVLVLALAGWTRAWRPLALDVTDYLVVAFVTWACASTLWAGDIYTSALAAERVVLFSIIFILARRTLNHAWIGIGAAMAAAATLGVEIFTAWAQSHRSVARLYFDEQKVEDMHLLYGGHGNINDETQVLLLAFALMVFIPVGQRWVRWVIVALSAAVIYWLAFKTTSNMAMWVFLVTVLVWGSAWLHQKGILLTAGLGLGVAMAFVEGFTQPDYLVFYDQAVATHLHPRLQLWLAALKMGWDYPTGLGIGMFDLWWPEYQHLYKEVIPWATSPAFEQMVRPGSAHGDFLQLWAELGVVGAALAAGVVWTAWRARPLWARAGLWVALCLGLVDFPFQKPATALLATLALAVCAGQPRMSPRRSD